MTATDSLPAADVHEQVALTLIDTGAECQTRVKARSGVVRDYARAMRQQISEGGLRFPPVILFKEGEKYWLGDGFHRILAAREAGLSEFPAEVRSGTQRDALLFAISSNAEHGLPRTNADKRKAVKLLLADAEWSQWNDREIARRCQVSQAFVTKLRRSLSDNGYQMRPRKVKRGDTVYEMHARARTGPTTTPEQGESTSNETAPAAPLTDGLGIPLRPDSAGVFAATSIFEAAAQLHTQLAALVDRLATSLGGAAYRENLVRKVKDGKPVFCSPELQLFAQKLASAAPHCGYCPRCHARHPGRVHPACRLCGGRGWLTKAQFEACPEYERQDLTRLRTQVEKAGAG